MKKFNVSAAVQGAQKTAKLLGRMINNHRPEILIASGVCGYVASLCISMRSHSMKRSKRGTQKR